MAADYYAILGITKSANPTDIKNAFRKLAKVYHPDKNPNDANAKQLFEQVLMAYTILSNIQSKKRYDDTLAYNNSHQNTKQKSSSQSHTRKAGQKEWTTSEEDLKRRDYFKQHYQQKKQRVYQTTIEAKNQYSDYKNILYAVPIAVALLMFIVSFFNPEPQENVSDKTLVVNPEKEPVGSMNLTNGAMPYASYFGNTILDSTKNELQINNSTNYDAVIVVFDKETHNYLQHAYLQKSFLLTISKLPKHGVYWKCVLGKKWNENKSSLKGAVFSGFDSIVQYQNWQTKPIVFRTNTQEIELLAVLDSSSEYKQYISTEKDFFTK